MKSKKVTTITNNDEWVRLEIFEGRIPLDKASEELLQMEKSQHAETSRQLNDERSCNRDALAAMSRRSLRDRLIAWWRGQP